MLCWFQPCVVPASEKVVRAWSLGSSRDMYQSGTPVAMGRPQPGCRAPLSRRQPCSLEPYTRQHGCAHVFTPCSISSVNVSVPVGQEAAPWQGQRAAAAPPVQ